GWKSLIRNFDWMGMVDNRREGISMRQVTLFAIMMLAAFTAIACVSQSSYDEVVAERDELNQQEARLNQRVDDLTGEFTTTKQELSQTDETLTAMTGERDLSLRQLTQANADLDERRQALTKMTGERDSLQGRLMSASSDRNDALDDLDRAQQDILTLNSQLSTKTKNLATTSAQLTQIQGIYAALQTQVNETEKYWDVAEAFLDMTRLGSTQNFTEIEAITSLINVTATIAATEDHSLIGAWDDYLEATINSQAELDAQAAFLGLLLEGIG
ncbi:MAG: hypothetical protein V3S37_08095, partial [Dehalococcoidia bacterium]